MKDFQSQICSKCRDDANASICRAPPFSNSNNCFRKSMSWRFKVFHITLNLWSISLWICPTIRKLRHTSVKYPRPTNEAHKTNIYWFLFFLLQLSAWMRNTGGNLFSSQIRTSPNTCIMVHITWLLLCLWWECIQISVYKPTPYTSTPHKCVFIYRDSVPFNDYRSLGTIFVCWSIPSTIKHKDSVGYNITLSFAF